MHFHCLIAITLVIGLGNRKHGRLLQLYNQLYQPNIDFTLKYTSIWTISLGNISNSNSKKRNVSNTFKSNTILFLNSLIYKNVIKFILFDV